MTLRTEQLPSFTDEELALLKADADETDRLNRIAGIREESFDRKRYQFARDVNEGRAFTREKTVAWARSIKRDLSGRTKDRP